MKRWIQPILVLTLTLCGGGVLLFPKLFVWRGRTVSKQAIAHHSKLSIARLRSPGPRLGQANSKDHSRSRSLILELARRARLQVARAKLLPPHGLACTRMSKPGAGLPKGLVSATARARQISKPLQPSPSTAGLDASNSIKPFGYIEQMDGKIRAFISGLDGPQVIDEGEVIGNQRVVRISPDSVELAAIELRKPIEAPGVALGAAPNAEPPTGLAAAPRDRPSRGIPPKAKPMGYVVLADGSQKLILPDGDVVLLQPDVSASPGKGNSDQQLAALTAPLILERGNAAGSNPAQTHRVAGGRSIGATGTPAADPSRPRPEPSTEVSAGFSAQASSAKPYGAASNAEFVGFVEKPNGQILTIVARASGIQLVPAAVPLLANDAMAVNYVGSPYPAETASPEEASGAASLGRSPPPKEQIAKPNDFSVIAESPKPDAEGAGGEVRPWFWGLPGLLGDGQATYSEWLDLPKSKPRLTPAPAAHLTPESENTAIPDPPLKAGQAVGFVQWADGRRVTILSSREGVQLVGSSGSILMPGAHPPARPSSAPSGRAVSSTSAPNAELPLVAVALPAARPALGSFPKLFADFPASSTPKTSTISPKNRSSKRLIRSRAASLLRPSNLGITEGKAHAPLLGHLASSNRLTPFSH